MLRLSFSLSLLGGFITVRKINSKIEVQLGKSSCAVLMETETKAASTARHSTSHRPLLGGALRPKATPSASTSSLVDHSLRFFLATGFFLSN